MVTRTGDWARARAMLSAAPTRLKGAISRAVAKEAHQLRNEIVQGLTNQAPGGEPILPPSASTLATRKFKGGGGSKALIVKGDLRNSITVLLKGDEAFIGILKSARSSSGGSAVNVAEIQEFGRPPVIIPMTPKMRRFLFAMLRKSGQAPRGGTGSGVVVVQVPARPFLRPAFNKFRTGVERRFLERVAKELGL
ncbi:MAG: hypothetical protein AB7K71_10740 [Polyangiaceae bacterium]